MNDNISKVQKNIVIFSIVGLALILVIGITYAYFSFAVSNKTTDLTSVSNIGLAYNDDTLYTISGLIPTSKENAIKGASRSLSDKCKDDNGYAICSLYEFTITNTANVAQELSIYMTPILNEYTNLKYMVYTGENTSITESTNPAVNSQSLTLNSTNNIELLNYNPKIKPNESVIYTILFYIDNLNYNQTEDMGKVFTAGININSITLGTFISGNFGESCWTTTQLESTNNYSLTAFNGLYENGEIKEECTGYISDDATTEGYQYTVNVPGTVGGKTITTVGDYLFLPINPNSSENNTVDPNSVVNEVNSSTKKVIPSLLSTVLLGRDNNTLSNAIDLSLSAINYANITNISISEGIKYIGVGSFAYLTYLNSVVFPKSLSLIDNFAFKDNNNLESIIFSGTEDYTSNLMRIGVSAFENNNLLSVVFPSSLVYLDKSCFYNNNLTTITIMDEGSNKHSSLASIGEYAFAENNLTYTSRENPLLLPMLVEMIGFGAFESYDLTSNNPNLDYIKPLAGNIYGNNWYNSTDTTLVLD